MRLRLPSQAQGGATRALLTAATLAIACAGFAAPARAEYVVLRSGQRLHVTGYQLLDGKYRLQMEGGFAELQAEDVVAIEPEEVFVSAPPVAAAKAPFRDLIEAAASRYNVDAELIASIIGVTVVKSKEDEDPMHALNRGFYVTSFLALLGFAAAVQLFADVGVRAVEQPVARLMIDRMRHDQRFRQGCRSR